MREFLYARWVQRLIVILHLVALTALIGDYGFVLQPTLQLGIISLYLFVLIVGIFYTVLKYYYHRKEFILSVFVFDTLSVLFVLYCLYKQLSTDGLSDISPWIRWAVILKLVREFTRPRVSYKRSLLNPARLFVISCIGLIVIGALLLMLHKATYEVISFVDALFPSTSAVCVTGLIVVDTSSYFTSFGQTL